MATINSGLGGAAGFGEGVFSTATKAVPLAPLVSMRTSKIAVSKSTLTCAVLPATTFTSTLLAGLSRALSKRIVTLLGPAGTLTGRAQEPLATWRRHHGFRPAGVIDALAQGQA